MFTIDTSGNKTHKRWKEEIFLIQHPLCGHWYKSNLENMQKTKIEERKCGSLWWSRNICWSVWMWYGK